MLLSSNQSDQSLPSKIAKLEARMVGKTSTTLQISAADVSAKFGANVAGGICAESLESSDSEEDDSKSEEDY
ncbi:putative non-specific serine/threonine protein kinase [Helianthus anomalus]